MNSRTKTELDERMQPVVIVLKGTMTKYDIQRLRKNGMCVVESDDPRSIRYMEPYPQGYSVQELAALELARVLLTEGILLGGTKYKQAFGSLYADILMRGDPLKRVPPVPHLQSPIAATAK